MIFRVPQFIEYETKLLGPLTYRQTIFFGIPAGITLLLYLAIGKTNFSLFLFLAIILLGSGAALAFLRIEGRPLPVVILNFFKHSVKTQVYVWKKGERAVVTFEMKEYKPKKEEPVLQVPQTSKLKRAKIDIETKTK
jgi:hypothetical protein